MASAVQLVVIASGRRIAAVESAILMECFLLRVARTRSQNLRRS
jgi:hypothetical protein